MQSSISLRADISQLRSEIGKIPGITKGEAERMVIALEKSFQRAEKAAKAATKSQQREAEKAAKAAEKAAADQARAYERSLDDIKRGSEKVFGGIVGDVEDVGKGIAALGGSAGPIAAAGLAFGAIVAGASAAAYEMHQFIASAIEARERLEEFAGVEPVPESALAALTEYERAMTAARVATDRLHVIVGGVLAESLGELPYIIVGVVDGLGDLAEYVAASERAMTALATAMRVANAVMTMGRSEVILSSFEMAKFAEAGRDVVDTLVKVGDEQDEVARAAEGVAVATKRAADSAQEDARATAEAAAEVNEFIKLEQKHKAEVAEILRLDAERRASAVETASTVTLTEEEIQAAFAAAHQMRMDQLAAEQEATIATAAAALESVQVLVDAWAQFTDAEIARHEATLARIEETKQAQADAIQAKIDAEMEGYDQMSAEEKAAADAKVRQLEAELKQKKRIARAVAKMEKQEMKEAYDRSKALSIAAIWATVPQATMSLIPGLALALGPLAASAPVAAAGIASLAATIQSAAVMAAPPPEFPTGGYAMDRVGPSPRSTSVDHVAVGVRPDERILSPQESRMYDGGRQPVYLMLDRRVIAEAVADARGTARLAPAAGRITGRATAYGRG